MSPDRSGWLGPALAIVAALTAIRVTGLWFDRTDLFVDESQYWLWGQRFDFGYYSKPPLVAWVIRLVTDLAGSDATFWVRLPGAFLHAATALILGALAARLYGARAALWTAAGYATLPFVAVGSVLISTDTVMAPFFAAALYFHFRAAGEGRALFAALAGVAIGIAFLGKYAAIYFVLGTALAAVFVPAMRIAWGHALLFLLCFAAVISPNIAWNLANDLTTVSHTMDNVGWVRAENPLAGLNLGGLAEFAASQFAVFGPVTMAVLLMLFVRPRDDHGRALMAFALPALIVVSVQALIDRAYANWAVSAYFAGTLIVMPYLARIRPALGTAAIAVNTLASLAVPAALAMAPTLTLGSDRPVLARYLGRADMSRQIVEAAARAGVTTVASDNRDILADLFHTGRDSGLTFRAVPPEGAPQNYYEQVFALPADVPGPVLLVAERQPICDGRPAIAVAALDSGPAYARRSFAAYLLEPGCAPRS